MADLKVVNKNGRASIFIKNSIPVTIYITLR